MSSLLDSGSGRLLTNTIITSQIFDTKGLLGIATFFSYHRVIGTEEGTSSRLTSTPRNKSSSLSSPVNLDKFQERS